MKWDLAITVGRRPVEALPGGAVPVAEVLAAFDARRLLVDFIESPPTHRAATRHHAG
jgi:hypothetical protein